MDDVNNMVLPVKEVKKAQAEDMGHMREKVSQITKKTKKGC